MNVICHESVFKHLSQCQKTGIYILCKSLFTSYLCHIIKWGCCESVLLYYYMKQCVTMSFFFHSKSSSARSYLHDHVGWRGKNTLWQENVSKVKRVVVDIIALSASLFLSVESHLYHGLAVIATDAWNNLCIRHLKLWYTQSTFTQHFYWWIFIIWVHFTGDF